MSEAEDFCDVELMPKNGCLHCHPDGPVPPTDEERADAIVKRIERGEARITITTTATTPMDFADWAESISSRPAVNGTPTIEETH